MPGPFEPEDDEDGHFHQQFSHLRGRVVSQARDLASRVRARVASADRPTPSASEVLMSGFAELINLVTRLFQRPEDDDRG